MSKFYFDVDGQKLNVEYEKTVSDTVNYLNAAFHFSDDWDGLSKYAHFHNGTTVYDMILINDCITAERGLNLSAGMWHVNLHGSILENNAIVERITTDSIQIYVEESAVISGEPFPGITPSIGEQIVAQATAQANAASTSASQALASKNAAAGSAQTATTKAGDASTYASQALASKNAAAGSAQTASQKASAANASAIAAAASAASCEPYDDTEIREELQGLNEGIANKLTKPSEGIAVGKYFRVASIDAEGNPVLEACDLPMVKANLAGIMRPSSEYGTTLIDATTGIIGLQRASDAEILAKTNKFHPIVPSNLDYATKSALSAANTSANAWTDAEKANACTRIGAYNPNKEWVLKGKIETGKQWTNVDLSGCTEIFIKGSITTTEAATLLLSAKPMNSGIISLPVTSGNKAVKFSHYITDMMGEMRTMYARFASNLFATYSSNNTTTYDYTRSISTLTEFGFEGGYFSKVETCNIEIYAR